MALLCLGGFKMTRTIISPLMMSMIMTPRTWMACQMPVGTGLKMGWGWYGGDRGILARFTIRVINCQRHTQQRNTSKILPTKSNANKRRYETQSRSSKRECSRGGGGKALPDISLSWTSALGPHWAHRLTPFLNNGIRLQRNQ